MAYRPPIRTDTYAKMLESTAITTCGSINQESIATLPPKDATYVAPEYEYTAKLFSYKTPPMPPLPSREQYLLIQQHTALDAGSEASIVQPLFD